MPGPGISLALADSLAALPELKRTAGDAADDTVPDVIREAIADIRDLPGDHRSHTESDRDDPPAVARNGGVIRTGYSAELDEISGVLHSGKGWIVELQEKEREQTGIKSLKIGYNRIFGYYIDITKPNLHLVPPTMNGNRRPRPGSGIPFPP